MRCRAPGTTRHRAFTIVEVVVVLGVLMMLAALVMPAARNSIDAAKRSADMAVMRQNAALISVYVNDYKGVYPLGFDTAYSASARWAQVLVAAGTVARLSDIDPTLAPGETEEWTKHNLTLAAVYPPEFMMEGRCRDPVRTRPSPVRVADVLVPDAKGLLKNYFVPYGPARGFWCCLHDALPLAPVVFCDGSAEVGRWTDYVPYPDRPVTEMIGTPIWSTWDGVRGIDKPSRRSLP